LLSSLPAADFDLLRSGLEPLELPLRYVLEEPNKPIKYVYFIESGFASVVAISAHSRKIEIGLIGREGMSGVPVIMGDDRSPNTTYMQAAGYGFRIKADDLRAAMRKSRALERVFLHFAQILSTQISHTAIANSNGNIDQRLARWLLMARDRLDVNEIPVTHEFLGLMLDVRRAGVTIATQKLQKRDIIRTGRKLITLLNYERLRTTAHGSFGIPEAEYGRLLGFQFGYHAAKSGQNGSLANVIG
jgi:CRP-like cAMP-binding protein